MTVSVIGGTERVKLTKELLSLIIMVQDYKNWLVSASQFKVDHNEERIDYDKRTEVFFNSLDSEMLASYKLSKNKLSYEKVVHFKVTDDIKSTLFEELPEKFTF